MNTEHPIENEKIARRLGLQYTIDQSTGFRRKRSGKAFQYFDEKNRKVKNPAQLKRIRSLVLPPAWQNVWICRSGEGHLQATGIDARGRKQYRYHPRWTEERNLGKFSKMLLFSEKLPLIRRIIQKDLNRPGLGKEKVMALIVRVLEKTMIRVGNEEYAKQNQSYGLTTIRNHHVKISGADVIFDFRGKSGKFHHVILRDKKVSGLIRNCKALPGAKLFAYKDEKGQVHPVTSQQVNDYLHAIAGEKISAKDFRTWGGTVCATSYLKTQPKPQSENEFKKVIRQTVSHTSSALRNTPAICRKYYIHPGIFRAFETGKMSSMQKNLRKVLRVSHLSGYEIFTRRLLGRA